MSGGVHHANAALFSGFEVDRVDTGTGTNNHFQVFGGIENCCVDDVASDDETFNVGNCFDEVVFCSFFEQNEFVSRCFNLFADAVDGNCCKGFFGSN